MKKKYVIGNVCYGEIYRKLFCDNHIKALLDPTNLPALRNRYDIEILLFTDEETYSNLVPDPNFTALQRMFNIEVNLLEWPPDTLKFQARYGVLIQLFQETCKRALERDAYLTNLVADVVPAKGFFPAIMQKMEAGHGAVFGLPIRSAAEPMNRLLAQCEGAPEKWDLWRWAFENMHPLWIASQINSPNFTKLPFCLLRNQGSSLIVNTFSISPHVIEPHEDMLKDARVLDATIPALCRNPYWATDWTDAPIAGVEPLFCYYPPFTHKAFKPKEVAEWALTNLPPEQQKFLADTAFYYPNFEACVENGLYSSGYEFIRQTIEAMRV